MSSSPSKEASKLPLPESKRKLRSVKPLIIDPDSDEEFEINLPSEDSGSNYGEEAQPHQPKINNDNSQSKVNNDVEMLDLTQMKVKDEPKAIPDDQILLSPTLKDLYKDFIRGKLVIDAVFTIEKGDVKEGKSIDGKGEALVSKVLKVSICSKCAKYNLRVKQTKGSKCFGCKNTIMPVDDYIKVRWE